MNAATPATRAALGGVRNAPTILDAVEAFGDVARAAGAEVDEDREGVAAALKIAEATALRLLETRLEGRPVLSSWEALQDYLQAAMAHSPVEEVRVLFLNAKNMLIANEGMWRGSVDEASMHVGDVMKRAMAHGATAIIIVHNHPSGDPSPSAADIAATRNVARLLHDCDLPLIEHVVIAKGEMRSVGYF